MQSMYIMRNISRMYKKQLSKQQWENKQQLKKGSKTWKDTSSKKHTVDKKKEN